MSNPDRMPRHLIEARNRVRALESAVTFSDIGTAALDIARAIEEKDDILGALASQAFMVALTALPRDLREDVAEAVSDEATRSQRADLLYLTTRLEGE